MILAISRFRVSNDLEPGVKQALLDRPRLVDRVPGFLGMEVFTGSEDDSLFYLVTRWTDEQSFRNWHASEAHRASHRFIPKGLKLDPSFTQLVLMHRITVPSSSVPFEQTIADAVPLLSNYLASSHATHLIVAALDGTIRACNEIAAASLKVPLDELVSRKIWEFLTLDGIEHFKAMLAAGVRKPEDRFLVNFVGSDNIPYTLECWADQQPDGFMIIGEPAQQREAALQEQLIRLNNELAVLARENIRKNRALEKAQRKAEQTLQELDQSYWHLRKIAELLPICMYCNRVRGEGNQWESVADYLKKNSLFLTHGCCPDCLEKVMRDMKNEGHS